MNRSERYHPVAAQPVASAALRGLLVSANADLILRIQQLLAGWYDIEVVEAMSAVKAMSEPRVDFLLLDVAQLDSDYATWAALLRNSERRITCVTVSSSFEASSRSRALRAGVDDHLMPPFERESLVARLDGLLATARMRQRSQTASADDASDHQLQQVLDALKVVQCELDLDSGSLRPSPQFEQLLGFHPGARSWSHDDLRAHVHVEDRTALDDAIENAGTCECRFLRADRSNGWLWLSSSPSQAPAATAAQRSLLLRDISGRKEAEHLLRDVDRRKEEFVATLAHELRNPLAPLRNGLQIMKLASDDREAVNAAREMMERQLEHMVRLVHDLLDMSRISHGSLTLQRRRIDIATVVAAALETSGPLIDLAGHDLVLSLPPHALYVEGDVTRLTQVITNLLDNAIKYTRNGGRIWLSVQARSGQVELSVRDNGVGIPPTMLARVFESFAQVTPSLERTQGGLGIGLSIVKRLIEMHGGTVAAHSDGHGQGSEFIVCLPLADVASATDSTSGSAPSTAAHAARRILVVDDNVDSALSLAAILELEGNELCTAHDGMAAVAASAAFKPNVIFLDIGLPELNGYEVCRRIRQQDSGRDAFIVALTGWGQQQDLDMARAAGFDRHLVKPVEIAVIENVLASLDRV